MNIFVLDENPKIAAQMHNDKHTIKMCVEYAQLLCGVHWMVGSQYVIPYKLSHKNHPCAIWARESIENYVWLCDLGLSLCEEYTHRYGKRHKSQDVIEWAITHIPNLKEVGYISEFPLAMPDECKIGNAVHSYIQYYITHKKRFSTWKNREIPSWFI